MRRIFGRLALIVLCCACGNQAADGFGPQGNNGTAPGASDDSGAGGTDPGSGSSGGYVATFSGDDGGGGGAPAAPCTDGTLSCYVPANCTTSLSGTVYDPAGKTPLYNVVVFVPSDPMGKLPKITQGTHSCNTCDVSIGNYVAATTSDVHGHFSLKGVPATTHVPIVVQTGKWRREVFLSSVTACTDNAVPAGASRLPGSRSEGDMPQMAISTGEYDNLGCFLHDIGISSSEYSAPHAGGRLDVYRGAPYGASYGAGTYGPPGGGGWGGGAPGLSGGTAGDCTTSSCPLWSTKTDLESYDLVLLACEGEENLQSKPATAMQAVHDWLDEGGKVFATHYHYVWFKNGPSDFASTANWLGNSLGDGQGQYPVDTSFPKGKILHDWLTGIGAMPGGTLALNGVATSVSTVNSPTNRWVYDSSNSNTKYMSFLTPIGGLPPKTGETARGYCGKAVFSDLHAGGMPAGDIPAACGSAGALTPQEQALEFLFFDLSACVAPENVPPPPPPPPSQTIQ